MKLSVGIMFSPTISFCLKGAFECQGERFEGQGTVKLAEGGAVLTTAAGERKVEMLTEIYRILVMRQQSLSCRT